jgi:hypothetical protein
VKYTPGSSGYERKLHALVCDQGTENVAVGRVGTERRVIGLAQRRFPADQPLAHPLVARRGLSGLGKLTDNLPDVVPFGHDARLEAGVVDLLRLRRRL